MSIYLTTSFLRVVSCIPDIGVYFARYIFAYSFGSINQNLFMSNVLPNVSLCLPHNFNKDFFNFFKMTYILNFLLKSTIWLYSASKIFLTFLVIFLHSYKQASFNEKVYCCRIVRFYRHFLLRNYLFIQIKGNTNLHNRSVLTQACISPRLMKQFWHR